MTDGISKIGKLIQQFSACISNDMLLLFKKVCRRFHKEYPETITAYIMIYKEMYEATE